MTDRLRFPLADDSFPSDVERAEARLRLVPGAVGPTPIFLDSRTVDDLAVAASTALQRNETDAARLVNDHLSALGLDGLVLSASLGVIDATVPLDALLAERFQGRLVIPTLVGGKATYLIARRLSDFVDEEPLTSGTVEAGAETEAALAGRVDEVLPGIAPYPYNIAALDAALGCRYLIVVPDALAALAVQAACGSETAVLGLSPELADEWAGRIATLEVPVLIYSERGEAGKRRADMLRTTFMKHGVLHVTGSYPPASTHDLIASLRTLGAEALNEEIKARVLRALYAQTKHEDTTALHSSRTYVDVAYRDEVRRRRASPYTELSTGVPEFDRLLGGGLREGLHVLVAVTDIGKTSFALNVARQNALRRRPCLYLSYEESEFSVWCRLVSSIMGISLADQRTGLVSLPNGRTRPVEEVMRDPSNAEAYTRLRTVADWLRVLDGGDALSGTDGAWNLQTVRNMVSQILEVEGAAPLVIVDYLQRMPAQGDLVAGAKMLEVVKRNVGLLDRLAKSVPCPVLAISSLSRGNYHLDKLDHESKLAVAKESGEIEYCAWTLSLLYPLPQDEEGENFPLASSAKPIVIDLIKNKETGQLGRVVVDHDRSDGSWRRDHLL